MFTCEEVQFDASIPSPPPPPTYLPDLAHFLDFILAPLVPCIRYSLCLKFSQSGFVSLKFLRKKKCLYNQRPNRDPLDMRYQDFELDPTGDPVQRAQYMATDDTSYLGRTQHIIP